MKCRKDAVKTTVYKKYQNCKFAKAWTYTFHQKN